MRTYTLELTAEELAALGAVGGLDNKASGDAKDAINGRLYALVAQAKADREADELRLPWRAARNGPSAWGVYVSESNGFVPAPTTERAAKLRSAAPELLEAVKAVFAYRHPPGAKGDPWYREVAPLIERALRKVDTGLPEEP